ncbi:ABC transporter permease [Pseudonocardia pini]|uniref:ABC transporter permease n=1 Tax=Pseudonocardia pini TaxID=2758030 RepID=UPI0015F03EC2|nr:ABC transporter permease [Pseudonocardia pini]
MSTLPLTDGAAAATRILTKLRHDPAGIALTLGAPVVLVLVFGFVFGPAIAVPGSGDYREYLVPGLFVVIAFNPIPSMVSMARDAGRGSVDRFRSLPISRAAIPFGQAAATAVYGVLCLLLMALCGLAVGWRIHTGIGPALGALGILVAVQFAATWIGMYLGLVIGREDTASQLAVLVFPFAMLSNIFVPTAGMPAWLRTLADWNPFSTFSAAVRTLLGNPTAPTNGALPLEYPVLGSLAWAAVLLLVFVPLCTVRYARTER